jgi:Cell shape-determining protein
MYNLIRFFQKHHFVILFLVLEVICFWLLATSQAYHRQSMVNATNDFIGGVCKTGSDIGNYFHLKKVNEQLAEENAKLRQQLSLSFDTAAVQVPDSVVDTIYQYTAARVVSNTINQRNNYIVIDKGRIEGIEKDNGVISSNGIVGVVSDVSDHYATIISLLHNYSVVSVRFKGNQHLANLKWETNDFRYGTIEDIPTHLKLKQGDTVVTSSFSYIFPEDLMVGTIEELYETPTGDLNKAKIRFATNFATLRNVYVIKNNYKSELDFLTNRRPKI